MLPRPIYEILPYAYIFFGAMSFFKIELMSGRVSGILLAAAGLIIYDMRRTYRKYMSKRG